MRPLETLDGSRCVAAVRLADPIGELVLVSSDDIDAAIGRPAIHDDIFETRIPLREHGPDGSLDKRAWLKEGVTIEIVGRVMPSPHDRLVVGGWLGNSPRLPTTFQRLLRGALQAHALQVASTSCEAKQLGAYRG